MYPDGSGITILTAFCHFVLACGMNPVQNMGRSEHVPYPNHPGGTPGLVER